jgi:tRNA dimethylallyltransferase
MRAGPGRGVADTILIAGPTASGKSALALAVAEKLDGVVINADSMQVYAELQILTARPSRQDEARAPHRLYGHVPLTGGYSVGRWLEDVEPVLAEVRQSGRPAIVTGGTGLYFKALTEGLSPMPYVPQAVRAALRARLAEEGAGALEAELANRDPEAAAVIRPGDAQRLVRALEVLEASGMRWSQWRRQDRLGALVDARATRIVLWPDRAELRARIDSRVDRMLAAGAIEEARRVAAMNPDPALPGYRAHGLRPLIAHLRGDLSLNEAIERTRAETRRYAKRQFTWLRHQMAGWTVLDPQEAEAWIGTLCGK